LFKRLRLPSIAGFIVVGTALGPAALGWVRDTAHVHELAEIGVVLLLFGIGTELSLSRLKSMWSSVLLGGGLQLTTTIVVVVAILRALDFSWATSIALGAVVSVSSTAIVLRELNARGELNSMRGRFALGILIFQDLAVVPMMLLLDTFSAGDMTLGAAGTTLARSLGFVVFVLVVARVIVPWWINRVARTRDRELFVLSIFVVCFGVAWLAGQAGLSMAIGAFLAGLAVSESEFRHQALADLLPMRDMFVALFFIAIGMSLELGQLASDLPTVLLILVAILAIKASIVAATAAVLRLPLALALQSGLALSQVGEFSIIMLGALPDAIVPVELRQSLVAAIVLSMILTPFAMRFSPAIQRLFDSRSRGTKDGAHSEPLPLPAGQDHAVVIGYGLTGRKVSESLQAEGAAVTVIDSNPLNVRLARAKGLNAFIGNATQSHILRESHVSEADLFVVSVNDPKATASIVKRARLYNPDMAILTRAQYAADEERLWESGADRIVIAESEAADQMAALAPQMLVRREEQSVF
ncbi:MAG: cation:proton antiporter, partial [Myxococcota bacterium]